MGLTEAISIYPSAISGSIVVPPSKSQTLRAILFASLAKGDSTIHNYLQADDSRAMITACRTLGAKIQIHPNHLHISGGIQAAADVIDAKGSGLVLRLIGAVASLLDSYTVITGDDAVRSRRIIQPLLDGLSQLGAFAVSTKHDRLAPIIVRGPLKGGRAVVEGQDSQPISGLLLAAALAKNPSIIEVNHPGETSWIEVTLDWLRRFGIAVKRQQFAYYSLDGGGEITPFIYTVPADYSSAAYPIAAALVTQSELTLCNIDLNDSQGDRELIFLLRSLGAAIEVVESERKIYIYKSGKLSGGSFDINRMIDALPILAVIGCFACSPVVLFNAQAARYKESDRIRAIVQELQKMGAHIEEQSDGLKIFPGSMLKGSILETHADHRIAMSLTVAALAAKGPSQMYQADAVQKTYPSFFMDLKNAGARIE